VCLIEISSKKNTTAKFLLPNFRGSLQGWDSNTLTDCKRILQNLRKPQEDFLSGGGEREIENGTY
jgi:hypothetical protein